MRGSNVSLSVQQRAVLQYFNDIANGDLRTEGHALDAEGDDTDIGDLRTGGHALDVSSFQEASDAALAMLPTNDLEGDWSQTDLPNAEAGGCFATQH